MSDRATRVVTTDADSFAALRRPAEAAQQASATMKRVLEQLSLRRAPEPRIARMYDGCEQGRPWFDAGHAVIVDPQERARILRLLRGGSVMLHAAAPLRDEISSEESTVPGDLRSDGTWIWSDAAAYYLENHWIAPDPELVAHLSTVKSSTLTDETWRRMYAAIRPDTWEGTIWPLD